MIKQINKTMITMGFMLLLSLSTRVASDDKVSIIIFDASGSMWGQLDNGRTKIEVAKEVMSGYFKDRTQESLLGIIAYGHNRKGDCKDIEIIAPVSKYFGGQHNSSLINTINSIQPKGKTPLTDALELAFKQIPKTAEEADLILITDGLETCGRDPCALAQEIADQGINIRAHVVGFGLSEKQASSLACISEKTGGHLLRPQSSEELTAALHQVETAPKELSINIFLEYVKGTVRPDSIDYSAKNLETGEVLTLGSLNDTVNIMRGLRTKLVKGNWLLMAKGPLGYGEVEISAKSGGEYKVPYQANKTAFSMKNYGPYQLGQSHSLLLNVINPVQDGLVLRAMLFPYDATDDKQRIDHQYLISLKQGVTELGFKSPKIAGKYMVIITKSKLAEQLARFNIEYVEEAKPMIKVPEYVLPMQKFAYEVYSQRYRNNSIIISKGDKVISKIWISRSTTKDGTHLIAPEKIGTYEVALRYKDAQGNNVIKKLATFTVVDKIPTKPTSNLSVNNRGMMNMPHLPTDF